MKTYLEMAEEIFRRRDAYIAAKKRRGAVLRVVALAAAIIAVLTVTLTAVFLLGRTPQKENPPLLPGESTETAEATEPTEMPATGTEKQPESDPSAGSAETDPPVSTETSSTEVPGTETGPEITAPGETAAPPKTNPGGGTVQEDVRLNVSGGLYDIYPNEEDALHSIRFCLGYQMWGYSYHLYDPDAEIEVKLYFGAEDACMDILSGKDDSLQFPYDRIRISVENMETGKRLVLKELTVSEFLSGGYTMTEDDKFRYLSYDHKAEIVSFPASLCSGYGGNMTFRVEGYTVTESGEEKSEIYEHAGGHTPEFSYSRTRSNKIELQSGRYISSSFGSGDHLIPVTEPIPRYAIRYWIPSSASVSDTEIGIYIKYGIFKDAKENGYENIEIGMQSSSGQTVMLCRETFSSMIEKSLLFTVSDYYYNEVSGDVIGGAVLSTTYKRVDFPSADPDTPADPIRVGMELFSEDGGWIEFFIREYTVTENGERIDGEGRSCRLYYRKDNGKIWFDAVPLPPLE